MSAILTGYTWTTLDSGVIWLDLPRGVVGIRTPDFQVLRDHVEATVEAYETTEPRDGLDALHAVVYHLPLTGTLAFEGDDLLAMMRLYARMDAIAQRLNFSRRPTAYGGLRLSALWRD